MRSLGGRLLVEAQLLPDMINGVRGLFPLGWRCQSVDEEDEDGGEEQEHAIPSIAQHDVHLQRSCAHSGDGDSEEKATMRVHMWRTSYSILADNGGLWAR
jgi:hypothetical protein